MKIRKNKHKYLTQILDLNDYYVLLVTPTEVYIKGKENKSIYFQSQLYDDDNLNLILDYCCSSTTEIRNLRPILKDLLHFAQMYM